MLTAIDRMKDQSGLDLFPHPSIRLGPISRATVVNVVALTINPIERMIIFGQYNKPWSFFATWPKEQGINSGPEVATRAPYP